MMTHEILGDSLAKGLVHQMGRDVAAQVERNMERLRRGGLGQRESRGARYREVIAYLQGFSGKRTLKNIESGERKKKIWESFVVEVDVEGGLMMTHFVVPFRNPTDFDFENGPFHCHPHGHQRLLQIHRHTDSELILSIWVTHFAAFERAFKEHDGWPLCTDASVLTFGRTEVMVWRPSTCKSTGWEAITAVGIDALYGPKAKAYQRLEAGYRDAMVHAVTEEDTRRYLGQGLRGRLAAYHQRRMAPELRLDAQTLTEAMCVCA